MNTLQKEERKAPFALSHRLFFLFVLFPISRIEHFFSPLREEKESNKSRKIETEKIAL